MLHYGPARKHLRVIKSINEPTGDHPVLTALKNFTDAEEPRLIRWLRTLWEAEQGDITYSQIRDDILAGYLTVDLIKVWQEDYTKFINEKMVPIWKDAMNESSKVQSVLPNVFEFDAGTRAVADWIDEHGTELAVNLSETQHKALNAVIQLAAKGEYGPDELARVIRPMIGMTPRNTQGCLRYYIARRMDGAKPADAKQSALNYAATGHRARAMNIARTELTTAYNQGADQSIRQAQAQNYIGKVKKKWLTAEDERVCEVCAPLDGVAVGQDDAFEGGITLPGAHPLCRCVVVYEEVKPGG